jgi:hypothetical protein
MILVRIIQNRHGHLVEALQASARQDHAQVTVTCSVGSIRERDLKLRGQLLVSPIPLDS